MTYTRKPNRKRKIPKRIWLNEIEDRELKRKDMSGRLPCRCRKKSMRLVKQLKRKAKKAGVSQSGLIRSLIRGYEPKEKPDREFFEALRRLSVIGNNVHQLASKANTLGFIDAPMLSKEVEEWRVFRADIVRRFISPDAPISRGVPVRGSMNLTFSGVPHLMAI